MQATWRKSDSGKSLKCGRAAERRALIPWKAAPPTSMLFTHALCMTYSDLSPFCLVEVMKRQRANRVAAVTAPAIKLLESQNTGKDTTRVGRTSIRGLYLLQIAMNLQKFVGFCVNSASVII